MEFTINGLTNRLAQLSKESVILKQITIEITQTEMQRGKRVKKGEGGTEH